MSKSWGVHIALTITGLIYGANYVIAKTVMPDYILPFGLIVFRVFAATILFWIFHGLFVKEKIDHPKDYRRFFFYSFFGVVINMLAFFKGLSMTSPINASIIMTMVPIIVLIVSYLVLKEKVTKLKIIGVTIGALGAILLLTYKGASWENDGFIGDVLILVNAVFYGTYLVIVKPMMVKYHPVTVVKWVFTFGFFLVLPFGYHELTLVKWGQIPNEIWLSIIYIIAGTTFSTYLLNAWAIKNASPTIAGSYTYLQPVFASVVAVLFTGENLPAYKIGFSLLIFVGVYLVSKRQSKKNYLNKTLP